MKTLQVTIGAAVTQFTALDIPVRQVWVQNNGGTNTMRVGDVNTSSTVGIKLSTNSSPISVCGPFNDHADNLKDFWVAGTQNDVLDVLYEA
jgi:hypothetical protein